MLLMFIRATLFLLILPLVEDSLYLYNTDDSLSVEFYDCIIDTNLPYCRRPSEPIALQRDQSLWDCYHNGTFHSFTSLMRDNISVSTVLHEWNSSIEKAEEYSSYRNQRQSNEIISSDEKYLCECKHPQSFGKHCEYLLPMGTTFQETIIWEVEMRTNNKWEMQRYSDIVCYTTLICNYGLLCLDWRDICDGVQHCMFGYDEENCDKLEFNECEDDEYRCLNGMCIPDEYFLDGDYDCLDLTDEKQQFNDTKCTVQQATYKCDDRMCFRYHWSCGDGQCIEDRFGYQTDASLTECNSHREQYHMCELHLTERQWTLPNGKCYGLSDYKEIVTSNRSDSEECIYFVKCVLSNGGEKNCPCKDDFSSCIDQLENSCTLWSIQYPNGAMIAPYAFSFYNATRDWSNKIPDGIKINGTIKCRGYMTDQCTTLNYPSWQYPFREFEMTLCAFKSNISLLGNIGYGEFCYNDSQTFNNRSYNFIDICEESKECISAYRIHDGYQNCADGNDELKDARFSDACSNIQRHRFRCSNDQPTCLIVNLLGDQITHCSNKYDEWWMGGDTSLSKFVCNTESKNGCEFIRQYVEASAKIDANNTSDQQFQLSKIPFRSFCDTFRNWDSKKDEDIGMCQTWWKCLENQWQCRSGQCIKKEWVLDGEWDCVDASDEQGLFVPINNFSAHNLNVINNEELSYKFNNLYSIQSFWKICNLSMEYPCFLANVSDPLKITQNRPCINLHQIGDGHVDCAGGLDERNTLTHCALSTMLGYDFRCSPNKTCISYSFECPDDCDDFQCVRYKQISDYDPNDFMCLDGQCAKSGRCNRQLDCSHGEDELLCFNGKDSIKISSYLLYRKEKELSVRTTEKNLQLPQLPIGTNGSKVTDTAAISMVQSEPTTSNFSSQINLSIPYYCNRGVGVQSYNGSIICFCPPQYYGDKCQFHNDRITFLFHLNLSQSIYVEPNNLKTMLKLLIIFLNEDHPLMIESFQTRVSDEIMVPRKKLLHLFYSRSNTSLHHKRARYFNRSNIITKQPYSVRIEAYGLNPNEKAQLVGVWLYPVYFDFLPSFRLAKVLHLTKPDTTKNLCSSNPCSSKQECHQILNQNSTYVCLCPPNFKGDNCSIIDDMCKEGFCSTNALCKPNYRGLLSGNERPYCICPLNETGHRCNLIPDKCHPNPCQNNGTCLSTLKPNQFFCLCDEYHYGDECQSEKRSVRLYIDKSSEHRAAVVQYFDINFFSLDLLLVHQDVHWNLPGLLHYPYEEKTAPGIIVVKLYYSNTQNAIYLISIQINVESFNGTTEVTEGNRCAHVQRLFKSEEKISPMEYHQLCIQNLSLLCFVDDSYLCICEENHSRVECFGYDHNLDQCSSCLNDGQCLKENRLGSKFLCVCPKCHYGNLCQFNSEYFSFTVDQLFSTNLESKRSKEKQITIFSLIFGSWLLFLLGLLNNICSFVTFRRSKCLQTGIGHYLFWMSVFNQIDLTLLALRLTHLTLNTTDFRSDPRVDKVFCKTLNYLLIAFSRIPYWFVSLIAIERVYTTFFLRGQWLKKPHIAKRLIMITVSIILITGSYELHFVESHIDTENGAVCMLHFRRDQHIWTNIHKIVTVTHTLVPFLINICCTMTISCIIIRKKMNINVRTVYTHPADTHQSETTVQQQQPTAIKESKDDIEKKDADNEITQSPLVKEKSRLSLLRDVLIENKELIIGPGVTLIPQLFSLPLLIVSIVFACREIEKSSLRYLLITSYLTTFIPQLTSFFLYIYPSSFYIQEWRLTNLSKWFQRFRPHRQQDPTAMATISATVNDINKLEITKL